MHNCLMILNVLHRDTISFYCFGWGYRGCGHALFIVVVVGGLKVFLLDVLPLALDGGSVSQWVDSLDANGAWSMGHGT